MKLRNAESPKVGLQMSALIDVVFLLLIYFMVTSALVKKEGDLGFMLPGPAGKLVDIPIEVVLEIGGDGTVMMDGMRFEASDRALDDLVSQLASLKQMAAMQQSEFFVNLQPESDALHGRIVNVMDACAEAGVKKLSFAKSI